MFEGRDEAICELLQTQGLVRLPPSAELRQGALTAGVTVAAQVIACGGLSRAQVLAAVAAHLGLSLELAPPVTVEPALLARVPRDLALARGIVPIRLGTEGLTVLALDPFDEPLSTDLAFALGQAVRVDLSGSSPATSETGEEGPRRRPPWRPTRSTASRLHRASHASGRGGRPPLMPAPRRRSSRPSPLFHPLLSR